MEDQEAICSMPVSCHRRPRRCVFHAGVVTISMPMSHHEIPRSHIFHVSNMPWKTKKPYLPCTVHHGRSRSYDFHVSVMPLLKAYKLQVCPQWLEHGWLVYRGWFKLFFQSLQNSSISSRKQIFRDFFSYLSWNCMLCVLISIASSSTAIAQENKYLGIFFLIHHGIVCCVYSLALPHRGNPNEYTQHTIVV